MAELLGASARRGVADGHGYGERRLRLRSGECAREGQGRGESAASEGEETGASGRRRGASGGVGVVRLKQEVARRRRRARHAPVCPPGRRKKTTQPLVSWASSAR